MDKFKQIITVAGMVITLVSACLPIIDQSVDIYNKARGSREGAK